MIKPKFPRFDFVFLRVDWGIIDSFQKIATQVFKKNIKVFANSNNKLKIRGLNIVKAKD